MSSIGLESQITTLLTGMNAMGDYPMSLLCSEQGLLLASAGELAQSETVAGLTSLCNDIVLRAVRDLNFVGVDEITLVDRRLGRFVIRPLPHAVDPRLYLVVAVPRHRSWRRNTSIASKKLDKLMAPLLSGANEPIEPAQPKPECE